MAYPGSDTRRGRVIDEGATAPTLQTSSELGVLEPGLRIRRLTPRECFRLQGWTDDYFERAQLVNNDNQLYKQAGNGVTVNVVECIAKNFTDKEDTNE